VNQVHVQYDVSTSLEVRDALKNTKVLKYDTGGLSQGEFTTKLVRLMKKVMRRSSCGPHWTEELKEFYEECNG
jgi:hypothetical protein